MQNFQTLLAEHDHLDELALTLVRIAERAEPDAAKALHARAAFSASLDDHLGRETAFLDGELHEGKVPEFSDAVVKFHSDFNDLAADCGHYLRLWDLAAADADWPRFCGETTAIMARLRTRINEENNLLYPLALRYSRIRLRMPA